MGFSLSRVYRTCLLVVGLAVWNVDAFVQNPKAFVTSHSKEVPASTHDFIAPRTKESRLSMILEQFIEGRDKATRKKETDKYLADVQKRVDRINALEASIEDLGDEELQAKTDEFRSRLAKGEDIDGSILEEAFAVVREAAW